MPFWTTITRRRRWNSIIRIIAPSYPSINTHSLSSPIPHSLPHQHISRFCSTKIKLTHQLVLSTLKNTPSDILSLSFFLRCARQPHFFHNRYAFDHISNVISRLLQQHHSLSSLIAGLQAVAGPNSIKPQSLLLLLRVFWHGGMYNFVFQMFDEMPNYNHTPNTYARNILIDVLLKIRRVDEALRVLRETENPNFLSFSIAIFNLCKIGDLMNIRDVSRRMLRNGYYLNDETFSSVLHCFCKSSRMAESLQILGLMISLGIPLSVNIWSILIDGYCKSDNIIFAYYLLEKMVESGCSPNVVTCTSLVKGLMKFKMPNRALRILSTMESKGCAPDLVLCHVLIDSLSKLGRYDDALDVYFNIPKWNLVPDSYTLGSIISMVCLSRQFDLLPLLISGVCIQADQVVSNSLLSYFCKAGYPSGAIELYNDMIYRGFIPDGYTYAGLLKGLCEMGRVHEAINVYNAIIANGFCGDPHLHTIIVKALVSSGKFHTAIGLFKERAQYKYPIDVVSYGCAIQGLVRGGKIQEAYDLFRQMKDDGVAPNAFTYNLIISGFCRVRDIEKVREILNEMIERGVIIDHNAFYTVRNLLYRTSCTPSSFSLFIRMYHSGSVLDEALGALLFKSLGNYENLYGNLVNVHNVDSSVWDERSDEAVAVG